MKPRVRRKKKKKYVRDFPQTAEFLQKVTEMMLFLLPHYVKEGKSYLTIAFGWKHPPPVAAASTSGMSVMMAEELMCQKQELGKKAC